MRTPGCVSLPSTNPPPRPPPLGANTPCPTPAALYFGLGHESQFVFDPQTMQSIARQAVTAGKGNVTAVTESVVIQLRQHYPRHVCLDEKSRQQPGLAPRRTAQGGTAWAANEWAGAALRGPPRRPNLPKPYSCLGCLHTCCPLCGSTICWSTSLCASELSDSHACLGMCQVHCGQAAMAVQQRGGRHGRHAGDALQSHRRVGRLCWWRCSSRLWS